MSGDPQIPYLSAKEVRQKFLDFFIQKYEHTFVPSSSVIPHEDPTLLFANAGMNQYKSIFQGTVDPNSHLATLKRAVNSQKCIRAGGKHNDLDDVGKDTYHHTFFEMLGNWSFGDFFKKEAIEWSWELLTKVYGLPEDRLYVTYFGGDASAGLEPDNEARDLWLALLPAERVLPFDMKDNFWEMGDTGPCGPCAEIHYDRVGGRDAASLVNMDDPDVLEIWNLVFMQFNRGDDGKLSVLPAKHIDTGMGFERITSVVQNKMSNYDTDVFTPFFDAIQKGTGCRAYTGKLGHEDSDGVDMAYRVVADHIRTLCIAIADGGLPGPSGRGYVLRRVVRRAIRYAAEKLKAEYGFFASLVAVVVDTLGDAFPELKKNPQMIKDVLLDEEQQFRKTLDRGRRLLLKSCEKATSNVISGDIAWQLYDTYGFPIDLTRLMAEEHNMVVDEEGYEAAKERAKELSRASGSSKESVIALDVHAIAELNKHPEIKPTDDSAKYNYERDESGNYVFHQSRGTIKAIMCGEKKDFVPEAKAGSRVGLLLDRTCFYAEQGGQSFDTGMMIKVEDDNCDFVVDDVQVFGGFVLHIGTINNGTWKVGEELELQISDFRRRPLMSNHTATHMLNFGLRKSLKTEVDQKGSLVAPDKLRFDFSSKAMNCAQIEETEKAVNELIEKKHPVYAEPATLSSAKKVNGLRAVFGEVYPDPVRVVSVGIPVETLLTDPSSPAGEATSVEFCGGTHLKNSADAEQFVIVSEDGIAKGIRRIVAFTGKEAKQAIAEADRYEAKIAALDTKNVAELGKSVSALTTEIDAATLPYLSKEKLRTQLKKLKKVFDDADKARKAAEVAKAVDMAKDLLEKEADKKTIVSELPLGSNTKALDGALKCLKLADKPAILFTADAGTGRVFVQSSVPKAFAAETGLKANLWFKAGVDKFGGKGGGKDITAMGSFEGSRNDMNEAIELCREFASKLNC
eukprot:Nk52_evm109s151 gene=Nk52_evmTU109s151